MTRRIAGAAFSFGLKVVGDSGEGFGSMNEIGLLTYEAGLN